MKDKEKEQQQIERDYRALRDLRKRTGTGNNTMPNGRMLYNRGTGNRLWVRNRGAQEWGLIGI